MTTHMNTDMNTDMNVIAERYIDAWNETDATTRRALIDELYTQDAGYTDPLLDAKGRDQIDAAIEGAQQQFAGLVFSLAGPVDASMSNAKKGARRPLSQDEKTIQIKC